MWPGQLISKYVQDIRFVREMDWGSSEVSRHGRQQWGPRGRVEWYAEQVCKVGSFQLLSSVDFT